MANNGHDIKNEGTGVIPPQTPPAVKLEEGRVHKTLGKYIKCKVHSTGLAQKNSTIFASIGLFTVEFKPNTMVEIPEAIVQLLKDATITTHHFDPNAISENGNKGAHVPRNDPKYIVEKE